MNGFAIVKAFMAEHGTDAKIFGRSRSASRVALRVELMRKLQAAGYTNAEIARFVNMDRGTVRYWLTGNVRAEKNRYRDAQLRKHRLYHQWEQCAQAMELRA